MAKLKSIDEVLVNLEDGDLVRELSAELQKAAAYLKEHAADRGKGGKAKGSITLKINLEVQGSSLTFESDYDVKLPKKPRASTTLFVSNKGEVMTGHPRQESFLDGDSSFKVPVDD